MDGSQFDSLTRMFSSFDVSRRSAIKLLGAPVLASALGRFGLGTVVAAEPQVVGTRCKRGDNCGEGAVCKRRRCRCAPGRLDCDGDKLCETNAQNDPDNCGSCGNACAGGEVCQGGRCACPNGEGLCGGACCRGVEICCDGVCRDPRDDAANCGTCGNSCPADEICQNRGCCVARGGLCQSNQDCCTDPFNGAPSICRSSPDGQRRCAGLR